MHRIILFDANAQFNPLRPDVAERAPQTVHVECLRGNSRTLCHGRPQSGAIEMSCLVQMSDPSANEVWKEHGLDWKELLPASGRRLGLEVKESADTYSPRKLPYPKPWRSGTTPLAGSLGW